MSITTVLLIIGHRSGSSRASSCPSPRSASSPTRRAASPSRWPSSRRSRPRPQAMQGRARAGLPGPGARPFIDRFTGARPAADPVGLQRADPGSKLNVAGNPPGLDRRPGALAQGRRHRRRPGRRRAVRLAAGQGRRLHRRRRRRSAASSATTGRTSTSTRRATTAPQKMQRALPDALDLLTISVEAGLGFDAALSQVARNTEGPLANEFARVLQEMQIGLGRSHALRAMGERSTCPTCALQLRDGAGRRVRHPRRPGAARAVQRDAGQAPPEGGGGGPEDPGEDHDPARAVHPSVPVHRGHRARRHRHDGRRSVEAER